MQSLQGLAARKLEVLKRMKIKGVFRQHDLVILTDFVMYDFSV